MVEDLYLVKDIDLDKLEKFLLEQFEVNASKENLAAALRYKGLIVSIEPYTGPAFRGTIYLEDGLKIDRYSALRWLPIEVLDLELVFSV